MALNKYLILFLVLVLALGAASSGLGSQDIRVYLDDELLQFEVPPFIQDGRTLVPMRAFFEALGAEVDWEADTRTAVGTRGDITVRIPIDSTEPTVNGTVHPIDVPAQIVNGRTFIPLRFVSEALGDAVEWDGDTHTITISREAGPEAPGPPSDEDPEGLEAMAEDIVTVWVELDITNRWERVFKAGDPPSNASLTSDISFQRAGLYTFLKLKPEYGGEYMALPGVLPEGAYPSVINLSITERHTCQDDQSLIIGSRVRHIDGEVAAWSTSLSLFDEGGGKVRIHVMPTKLDIPALDCPVQNCYNGFGFSPSTIGENPDPIVDPEHGYHEILGFDLGVFEWASLKAIDAGGEIPLALPLSVTHENREDYEDPPGYPAHWYVKYTVQGSVSSP